MVVVGCRSGGDGRRQKGAWADGWRVNRTLAPRRRLREARPRAFTIERAPSPIRPSTQPHPPFLYLSPTSPLSVTTLYTLPSLEIHPLASAIPIISFLIPPHPYPYTGVPNYGYVLRIYRCLYIYTYIASIYICNIYRYIYIHISILRCMYDRFSCALYIPCIHVRI